LTCVVSAVVVAYNEPATVIGCLRSVEASLARLDEPSELVVVLNRGSDEFREEVRPSSPDAVVVEPPDNLGFAGGVSAGIDAAAGEWIALVNDDCVVDERAFEEFLAVGRSDAGIGSVAGQVRFARRPQLINSAGLEIDRLGVAYERLLGAPADDAFTEPVEVFGPSGAFALYRRAMLDAAGGFDATFFAYLEDADLAWRARMLGWRCVYAPRAVAMHEHSPALGHGSRAKHFLVGRNRVRMIAKNATAAELRRRWLAMIAYDCAYVGFVAVTSGTLAPLRGRLRGLREWRAFRARAAGYRRAVPLAPPSGLRAAVRRYRVYRSVS
jgi:GT2 family glycosyltransferase